MTDFLSYSIDRSRSVRAQLARSLAIRPAHDGAGAEF
jgi:hypothetical protein